MQNKKIVFLASDCESSRWVYNALNKDFQFEAVIIEQPLSKKALFKNRIKKISYFKVMGQVLFSLLLVPLLRKKAKYRKAELIQKYQLHNTNFISDKIFMITSVNDEACKQVLHQIQPDIILVNGTRIISKKILRSTKAIFINMHVGITPWYRGSHGGYWALYNKDSKNFGTTIHLVDEGVDTGSVIAQVFTTPTKEDNFTTYPILQTAIGIEALKEVLPKVITGKYEIKKQIEKGKMYYQPTVMEYALMKVK
jgi:methionyl-tRNA formyltransferase